MSTEMPGRYNRTTRGKLRGTAARRGPCVNEPVRFYSTNRQAPVVGLAEALLQGQAPDRGLYLPQTYPQLTRSGLLRLRGRPYAEVAWAVLRGYTRGVIDDDTLRALCEDAYNYEVPLEQVTGRSWLLRLDRGPTASFKDFAARMMARWMGALVGREHTCTGRPSSAESSAGPDHELVILTATSGDTGSAVAHAYFGVPGVQVVVLFPPAEVSVRQRKQMTTIGGNVTTIGIDGKFDDCQALVKRAFADPELRHLPLTSANSINIGRLLPQTAYYVYAYVNLADVAAGEPVIICVPSGNFGNMMGAVIAGRMGLPLRRLVIATNANDEVPVFLRTGVYRKISPSRVCISNAMNVGHPSNLARLVDVYGGWMDETGTLRQPPDLERMRRDLYAISISDDQTRATIRDAYQRYGVLLEPHGAVGWAGLEHFLRENPAEQQYLAISVETAHPAKFPEEIQALLGVVPPAPPSLAGIEQRPEHYETLPADYQPFKEFLVERFGSAPVG
jgi:threonine synthase